MIEHTTFRQKFGLWQQASAPKGGREVFAVNIDTIIAQDLETKRIGTYQDIDISSVEKIDAQVLSRLTMLTKHLAARYNLRANPGTKAWRDAQVIGRAIVP